MEKLVLLVEDNEQNRYLMRFLLEKHGYSVVIACDGMAAIELVKTVMPSLILLDIQLPRLDGYQVARIMRDDKRLQDIPIIAVTSYAMMGDRETALAAGCDAYIEKPINPDTFISEIEAFMPKGGS
jgi:two-component system cell cycle response regulator DivK